MNLLAPNGKPSNLTPEQWELVRTPHFKAWFGDWENDTENASKVIDENGEPLVVYHGSSKEINNFKSPIGKNYFSPLKYIAQDFADYKYGANGKVYEVFLNLKLPKYFEEIDYKLLELEQKKSNDGFIAKYVYVDGFNEGKQFVTFESNQIKLADGSNTTFDGSNPDIRFDEGGRIEKMIENGVVELKMYDTTPEHAKEYGLKANNPLFIQRIFVSENDRNKGLGKEVLQYVDKYAKDNGHDLIFGHIQQKANQSRVKILLEKNGYTTIQGNNDFYKFVGKFSEGGRTKYGVDELYEIATRTFIGLGYDVTQGSNSQTDYGHSRYFYVNQNDEAKENSGLGFQVRVSDHSTGDRRILSGEQFIFDKIDVMVVFNRINYWFHPEEYKNVVAVKTKVVKIEVGENDLRPSDTIISERVAKSGNKRYTIKRTYKNEGVIPTHIESGYKMPFKPNNPDIRFAEGGETKKSMKKIKRGGITYGKSHAEGGIPVKNQSTGDMLEVEGGEGIVNKRSMASADKVTLNGKEMTICEAVSHLNQMEGGVKFNCNDVEHRQFLEEMARGGELERGTKTEQEHIQVLKDLYAKRITPKQASKLIAEDHLKEDSHYYSKLAKMEGKMADGGRTSDNPFAEFGLIKDFKGDAFEKLDAMERIDTNYCEINKTNCSSTKGIDRKDMPQIYEEHIDEYIDFLDENGITHEMEWGVEVGKLKPTQANISVPRIKKILTRLVNGYYTDTYGSKLNPLSRRLLATKDGFILDGHHRWASLLFLSPKNKINVFRINANINDIIALSKKFNLVAVSEFAYGGKVDVKVPNYTSKDTSDITSTIIKRGGFPQAGLYFAPANVYGYDETTQRRDLTQKGYTNEMVTLIVGTRNFSSKRAWSFSTALNKRLKELQNEPKYENFKDLSFYEYTEFLDDALVRAKNRYNALISNGVDPSKCVVIVTSYGNAKASLGVNIYTPPALDYLTQGEEFFDFVFDAVNLISQDPNKNTEASKKLAKEESAKRKEAQKGEGQKIVNSTEYPKEINEYNPRHLYRLKTATELELQYGSQDWKTISEEVGCEWLKKATNRKILGLKVPKESQYILKFLFSTTYIFCVYNRESRKFYVDNFGQIFNIDLDAYKIKGSEMDSITQTLFTIEAENYYDSSDVQSDIGAKILNELELQIASLKREDFYENAIKLTSPSAMLTNIGSSMFNVYQEWYESKIELISEGEYNAFIPSEIWQYLKYCKEENIVFDSEEKIYEDVSNFEFQNGVYVGVDYGNKVIVNNVDERVVNFVRFMNFVDHRISSAEYSRFKGERLSTDVLRQIFNTYKITYISSLGLVNSSLNTTDNQYAELSKKYQKAYTFFGLNKGNVQFRKMYENLFSIDISSAFFEEVDFNNQKVNLEIRYLSKEQLGNDDIAQIEYIDKVFNGSEYLYKDVTTFAQIGFPSAMALILGQEVEKELLNVFKVPYATSYKKGYKTLDAGKYYPSSYSHAYPPSFSDLKEENGGYRTSTGGFVCFAWVKWLLFAKENLAMENVQTDNALVSYFYGGAPEFVKNLRIQNPYDQINDLMYTARRVEVGVYSSRDIFYQISTKIEDSSTTQSVLVKKKSKFEEQISSLTQLLQVFGNDEPLKQNIIYNKIARVRKEQESFIQKKYFKGDLSKLLELYAMGQQLGGQRDLANVVQCGMSTPTGEPSELDLMQYKLVRTPEFKKWFGDWEEAYITKDYSAVSKAINPKTAEPIVCYHGKGNMRAEATYFNLANFPVKYVGTNLSYSVWFARNGNPISVLYEFYAKLINPIDLSKARLGDMTPNDFKALVSSIYGYDIKTRLMAEDRPQRLWQILRANPLMLKEIRDNTNYDGLIIYEDNPSDVLPSGEFNSTLDYIIFDNKQLKSADNRNSTFLIDSPDFRFDDGGLIKSNI